MAWFDDSKNSTGALTTRLANDASQVKGVSKILVWNFIFDLVVVRLEQGFDWLVHSLDFDNKKKSAISDYMIAGMECTDV